VRPCLDEPNILTLLPKALTAEIEAIFADETGGVSADAAVEALWSAQFPRRSQFVRQPIAGSRFPREL
jgi:hypothetical protein